MQEQGLSNKKESQVSNSLDSARNNLETLQSKVDNLTTRLQTILRNEPCDAQKGSGETCVNKVPLAESIDCLAFHAEKIGDQITDISERIEL